mgnify:FL=1
MEMETDPTIRLRPPYADTEHQKTELQDSLFGEILSASQEMGLNLSEENLRIVLEGPTEGDQKEAFVLPDIAQRAANYQGDARDAREQTRERRIKGAKSLILLSASYLKGNPELAEECLRYAMEVWRGEKEYNLEEVPQSTTRVEHPAEKERRERGEMERRERPRKAA